MRHAALVAVALLVPTLWSFAARAATDTTMSAVVGVGVAHDRDGTSSVDHRGSASGFELQHRFASPLAVTAGYRQFVDDATQETSYQAGLLGARFFPLETDAPEGAAARAISPFVDGQVALGHVRYQTLIGGAGELGADTLGLVIGAGVAGHYGRFAATLSAAYEQLQSRGGGATALALTGANKFAMLGLGAQLD